MQGLKQELRLKQELTLQPQQILRSELIQMPLLELELRVVSELEQNPFLEEADPREENSEIDERDSKLDEVLKDGSDPEEEVNPKDQPEEIREVDWDDFLNDADHWEYRPATRVQNEGNVDLPQPDVPTLSEHLYEQLRLDNFDEAEMKIGEEIIGNINRDGYLEVELEEIATTLATTLEKVEAVHSRLVLYDPIGIGSRNLRECLLIQLEHFLPHEVVTARMLRECWEDFINKRFETLADKLDVDIGEVKAAFQVIVKLNPKPGEGYFDEKQNYVIPDLVVSQVGNEYVVYLNDGDIPNFRINAAYREMFTNKRGTEKTVRDFLSRKLESARWFINAIHQRRTTMIRTMNAIVEKQKDFFEKGPTHLKPMILADIASEIGMDISTISRVTNGKYVQTDWGVFELKYFFSERMETDSGNDVSNRVIKGRLKEMIDKENKKKPYSDQELTDLLNKEGFQIRRRTVAKYREQMRIPIKRLRRQI